MRSISPFERFGEHRPEEDANLKEYIWNDSDTITGLAHREYEDWRMWGLIARRNQIYDLRQIPSGRVLLIPERPLEKGQFEL